MGFDVAMLQMYGFMISSTNNFKMIMSLSRQHSRLVWDAAVNCWKSATGLPSIINHSLLLLLLPFAQNIVLYFEIRTQSKVHKSSEQKPASYAFVDGSFNS